MSAQSLLIPAALLSLCLAAGCDARVQASGAAEAAAVSAERSPRALAPWQDELLAIAFTASSAFPRQPHLKNRSRAQERVIEACLELDQADLAFELIPKIDDWRRGAAYADLAFHRASRGQGGDARHCLELAEQSIAKFQSDTSEDSGSQSWRLDRVRAKMARAWLALGETEQADRASENLDESAVGIVAVAESKLVDSKAFDAHLAELDRESNTQQFDRLRGILDAYTELHARFYADEARRALLEERVVRCSAKMPATIRIELLAKLADTALEHQDAVHARPWIDQAQAAYDAAPSWQLEHGLPVRADLARLLHRAGARDEARAAAAQALGAYDAGREQVVDIYRAGALRSLAEAYASMGDRAAALSVYRKAVEEGVHNPNSRPRAEDLSETCCSMAIHGVEPDAALHDRLSRIGTGLGDPW